MSKGTITDKQREILEYIKSQILERGFPPAVREICEAVNLKSTSSVHSHLETLERQGKIFVLRPLVKPVARMERNTETLTAFYDHGYQLMEQEYGRLMEYLTK